MAYMGLKLMWSLEALFTPGYPVSVGQDVVATKVRYFAVPRKSRAETLYMDSDGEGRGHRIRNHKNIVGM